MGNLDLFWVFWVGESIILVNMISPCTKFILSIIEPLSHQLLTKFPQFVRLDLVQSVRLDGLGVWICDVAVLEVGSVGI